ncbi:MAG TPA: class II fumarate hydratase [Oligoflexia bacterium]|nr:class II fumarate hydratase [Oligoflexia bacterium]HMP27568.1 class II fumarate hydratase [Oligoflexia bacterium]
MRDNKNDTNTRIEKDSMGEMRVPKSALWGASTQRAALNFPISGLRFPRAFVKALGIIKLASAKANQKLKLIDSAIASAIIEATKEVKEGLHDQHFILDIFQTGSGTSTNMNANEVIATIATSKITASGYKVHPNDHVNFCQSSNDVIPTAIHLSARAEINERLLPALNDLQKTFVKKALEYKDLIKAGRTHLQDATPITLGQEFSGWATQIERGIERLKTACLDLDELALGGTAVGTGLNTDPKFANLAIEEINSLTALHFKAARSRFEAQSSQDSALNVSSVLRTLATAIYKIANDIRWLASGPRCGLGEINLPETQPGSSIMPAKVNPVICESTMMVAAQIIGNDATIAFANSQGNFQLNTMLPVIAYNLLQSIDLLTNASNNFNHRCLSGITANDEKCKEYAEKSLATVTSLAPKIGYEKAAEVAKQALAKNLTIKESASKITNLSQAELEQLLNLSNMTKPGL